MTFVEACLAYIWEMFSKLEPLLRKESYWIFLQGQGQQELNQLYAFLFLIEMRTHCLLSYK